jgi:Dehydratase family
MPVRPRCDSLRRPAYGEIKLATSLMSTSRYRGERLGKMSDSEIDAVERRFASTADTCAVMGTASMMASIAEASGMMPAGAAAVSTVDADRLRIAEDTGCAAVALIRSERRPSQIINDQAVENALLIYSARHRWIDHLARVQNGAFGGEGGHARVEAHLDPPFLEVLPAIAAQLLTDLR